MSISVVDIEKTETVDLLWTGERDDVLPNPQGVEVSHVTRVEQGAVEFTVDGYRPRVLRQGEEIVLPVRTPYKVRVTEGPAMVRCLYPKTEPALRDIQHLRSGGEGRVLVESREVILNRATTTTTKTTTIRG